MCLSLIEAGGGGGCTTHFRAPFFASITFPRSVRGRWCRSRVGSRWYHSLPCRCTRVRDWSSSQQVASLLWSSHWFPTIRFSDDDCQCSVSQTTHTRSLISNLTSSSQSPLGLFLTLGFVILTLWLDWLRFKYIILRILRGKTRGGVDFIQSGAMYIYQMGPFPFLRIRARFTLINNLFPG